MASTKDLAKKIERILKSDGYTDSGVRGAQRRMVKAAKDAAVKGENIENAYVDAAYDEVTAAEDAKKKKG